ncbi:hypothetical protein H1Z61_13755 [Bacillus aquiflavi]|uniref:Uncharacterized protein n=1 Tax=Bacillus aquiflavi TaxID=2672567 RepID=A0A6B3VWP7_9BACI|nr:hypothetical protein [Bacillus aquiflavi]MBA4538169.1 hypothetical protein [Bacillus aquiflavi]NEY82489.1 hypothetical protein [Bacillus aquiflavi]UAC48102.1 hypothetical protein K6959_16205 [Bacillus aquiflavi]
MKNFTINKILFILFLAGLIMTIFIVYKDMNSTFSYIFVILFVIYLLVYALFLITLVMINIRKLKRTEIRKRTLTFIILFVLFSAMIFITNYAFQPEKNDKYSFLITALGCSFGVSFFDLAFFKKEKSECL